MALGLVSEVFLIYPPECLTLVLHGILWDFTNKKATQGGTFMILLIFLDIITLFYILMMNFKGAMVQPVVPNQEISLSYRTKNVLG